MDIACYIFVSARSNKHPCLKEVPETWVLNKGLKKNVARYKDWVMAVGKEKMHFITKLLLTNRAYITCVMDWKDNVIQIVLTILKKNQDNQRNDNRKCILSVKNKITGVLSFVHTRWKCQFITGNTNIKYLTTTGKNHFPSCNKTI